MIKKTKITSVLVFGIIVFFNCVLSAEVILAAAPTVDDLQKAIESGQIDASFEQWEAMRFDPDNPGKIIGCDTRTHSGDRCVPIDPATVPGGVGALAVPNSSPGVNYKIMEAIPGFFNAGSSISFPDLISAIYKFGIWTVGIAALFMITVGGFMYATSAGNTSTAGSAKSIISDALLGLVVAMTAYLILNVINPDLVRTDAFKQGFQLTSPTGSSSAPVSTETAEIIAKTGMQDLAVSILNNGNIKLQGKENADCVDKEGVPVSPDRNIREISQGKPMTTCNSTCKSQETPCEGSELPSVAMLRAMLTVAQNKSYTVTSISGGQHSKSGSAHYKGLGLDIVPLTGGSWTDFVKAFRDNGSNTDQTFWENPGGNQRSLTCTNSNHIHIMYNN